MPSCDSIAAWSWQTAVVQTAQALLQTWYARHLLLSK